MKLTYVDFLIVAVLLGAMFLGFRGGVLKKVFNILALLACVVLGIEGMHAVGGALDDIGILNEPGASIAGFALIVVALMTASILLYRKFGKTSMANSSSQFFGAAVGLLEGLLVCSLVLVCLRVFDVPEASTRNGSLLYRPITRFAPRTFDLLHSYFPGASGVGEELSKIFEGLDIHDIVPEVPPKP
jgi:uncharacterized membrane protein required for colicin V production